MSQKEVAGIGGRGGEAVCPEKKKLQELFGLTRLPRPREGLQGMSKDLLMLCWLIFGEGVWGMSCRLPHGGEDTAHSPPLAVPPRSLFSLMNGEEETLQLTLKKKQGAVAQTLGFSVCLLEAGPVSRVRSLWLRGGRMLGVNSECQIPALDRPMGRLWTLAWPFRASVCFHVRSF